MSLSTIFQSYHNGQLAYHIVPGQASLILYCIYVQGSPFLTHLVITRIKDLDITESCNECGSQFFYHGILQSNYRKMTISWSISMDLNPLYTNGFFLLV